MVLPRTETARQLARPMHGRDASHRLRPVDVSRSALRRSLRDISPFAVCGAFPSAVSLHSHAVYLGLGFSRSSVRSFHETSDRFPTRDSK